MKAIKLIIMLLLTYPCFAQINLDKYLIGEEGIIIEKHDSLKQYDEIYNTDNIIYTVGKKFNYSYYYLNQKGEKFLIKRGKPVLQPEGYYINDWEFINFEKQDYETVTHISLSPKSGNPFPYEQGYNQTAIKYEYLMSNGNTFNSEITGAIENEMNVWIHPPRNIFFKILEINPFPYIKAPYKVGTKWNWKLEIGEFWSDKRWLVWEGGIENNYEYEIIDKKSIATKLGKLECFVIQSKAVSRIGATELIAYFNLKFGFVKLDYKNIDGTKTVLELESVDNINK